MTKCILLGTTNPEKLQLFRQILTPLPVEILAPRDLGIAIVVEEDGVSPQENAEKKARAYFAAAGIPTLAIDAGLYIEKFPPDKQPGVFVRRIHGHGRDVSDQEVLDHYIREIEHVGGESLCAWNVGVVLMVAADKLFSGAYSTSRIFTSRPSPILLPGAPLASLTIDPASGKYFSEMDRRERPDARWYFEFVQQHLREL